MKCIKNWISELRNLHITSTCLQLSLKSWCWILKSWERKQAFVRSRALAVLQEGSFCSAQCSELQLSRTFCTFFLADIGLQLWYRYLFNGSLVNKMKGWDRANIFMRFSGEVGSLEQKGMMITNAHSNLTFRVYLKSEL